jgi:pimeloyl-ACP methyl ester carboxylesterase
MLQNLRPSCLPLVLVTLAMLLTSCTSVQRDEDPCSYGVYVKGQEKVVLSDGYRGSGPPQTAYTFIDGRRGNLGTQDAELRCVAGVLYDKAGQPYQSLPLSEQDFSFESNGVTLAGRLIIPPSREGDAQPLAVFVHGSENTVTVGHSRYPWILAAQGVSVFVYDKRGTGQSEGTYTQDFQILADDAAAAFRTANEKFDSRNGRIGFFGGSQGGWVAPLAATKVSADFLVIGFGLILSPAEEDAEQVFEEMRRLGFEAADLIKARQVTNATAEVVASHFTEGVDDLIQLRDKFKSEAWLDKIEGEYTGSLLRASERDLKEGLAPGFEDDNVDWHYDAVAVIRSLSIPQLWVIAENDRAAPGQLTYERLRSLQAEGKQITTALFPNTDHGMVEFTELANGERQYTRFTDGYFRLIADYVKGVFAAPYGNGKVVLPSRNHR